LNKGLTNT